MKSRFIGVNLCEYNFRFQPQLFLQLRRIHQQTHVDKYELNGIIACGERSDSIPAKSKNRRRTYRICFLARRLSAFRALPFSIVRISKPYVATISSWDLGACERASYRSCFHLALSSHSFLPDLH